MRVPVKSERDAFHIVWGGAALIGCAGVIAAIAGTFYAVALALGGFLGAVIWDLVTEDADRRRPLREAARQGPFAQDGRRRILVIANETLRGEELLEAIVARGAGHPIVRVVAPVLPSRAHYLASDIDRELAEARHRLEDTLAWAAGLGIQATGRVHGDTPFTAIEDEVRSFAADELIISTHPPARSRWLETGLVDRAREELEIPVTHVVVDVLRANLAAAAQPYSP